MTASAPDLAPVAGCEACEKNVLIRRGEQTIYNYQFREINPQFGVIFYPQLAQMIMEHRLREWLQQPRDAEPPAGWGHLDTESIQLWQSHALDVNEAHALYHIPPGAAWRPGILVDCTINSIPPQYRHVFRDIAGNYPPQLQPDMGQTILMDGNHRALRALHEGRIFHCYKLTDEEAQACFAGLEIGEELPPL